MGLVYAGVFAASVAILGVVVFFAMSAEGEEAMRRRVRAELAVLAQEMTEGGLDRLTDTAARRALGRDELHYLITLQGRRVFGDLAGDAEPKLWFATTLVAPGFKRNGRPALARSIDVGGGVRLTVGATYKIVEELREATLAAFGVALGVTVVLGAVGGVLISRNFLRRIDAITRTAEAITSGDLTRRVELRGTGDDLDRLSATLNRMLDRTQELMESLRQVSNDIAHDLRTPLARLRQKLEGARTRAADVSAYACAVDGAIEETDAILSTFASLLRIAQIEAGTRRSGFARVDLAFVAGSVAEAFAPSAEDLGKAIALDAADPATLLGDRDLLTQLTANLVENALNHSGDGKRIEITVARRGPDISLRVADDGPGVPEAERENIFRRFYRLERSRSTPGNGLGLSLVGAVAELHGARLTVSDAEPGLAVELRFAAAP